MERKSNSAKAGFRTTTGCRFAAVLVFLVAALFCSSLFSPRAYAQEEPPPLYQIETEWGYVSEPSGYDHGYDDPFSPSKAPPPPPVKGLDVPVMKKAQPTLITAPEKEPEPQPEPPKPPAAQKPPKPGKPKTPVAEKKPPAPQPPPKKPERSEKRSLFQNDSFTLEAASIIYNRRNKTIKATSAVFDGTVVIIADEIKMDLHSGILAASGNVKLLESITYVTQEHFTGDFALYNLITNEAVIRGPWGQTALSFALLPSYSEVSKQYGVASSLLLPEGRAVSLEGISGVDFPDAPPEDLITALRLSLSGGYGLTLYNASFTFDSGKSKTMPVLEMRNGDLFEDRLAPIGIQAQFSPSEDYKYLTYILDYYLSKNPGGKAYLSDNESRQWSKDGDDSVKYLSYTYGINKKYTRGNDVLSVAMSKNDSTYNYLNSSAGYSHYWFPRGRSLLRFNAGYTSSTRELPGALIGDTVDKTNSASLWLRSHNKGYIANLSAEASNISRDNIPYSSFFSIFYEHINYDRVSASLSLLKKPAPFFSNDFLYSLYYSTTYQEDNRDYRVMEIDYDYAQTNTYYRASVYNKPLLLLPRVLGIVSANWEYASYIDREKSVSQDYNLNESNGSESADGRIGARWAFSKAGSFGADYVWERYGAGGTGWWHTFLTFSPSQKWNVRLSSRYLHELQTDEYGFPDNVYGESLDISYRANPRNHVFATWDLDSPRNGVTLSELVWRNELRSGHLSLGVTKDLFYADNGNYHSPYRYILTFIFR